MLQVIRNGKNSMFFLLILLNLSPNKFPFSQYYSKSVPNPDILIILLPKNKIVVLAKILFLTIFSIYLLLKCIGGADFDLGYFSNWIAICLLFCNLHEVSYKI